MGLIIGLLIPFFDLPHEGGFIPVFILEILGFFGMLFSGDFDFPVFGVLLTVIISQILIIVYGRKDLKSNKNATILAGSILLLNGLSIYGITGSENDNTETILLYSSIILYIFSGLAIINILKINRLR